MSQKAYSAVYHGVRAALAAAGERECSTRRTRTTGRVRYTPGEPGFRLGSDCDPTFMGMDDCVVTRQYLYVTTANRSIVAARRHAAILNAAGYAAAVAPSYFRKYVRAWVKTPFPLADESE